jgi:hypothetical protein
MQGLRWQGSCHGFLRSDTHLMDAEDFEDIDEYWELLCIDQDICSRCYAPHLEHDVDKQGEKRCVD